MIEIIPAIDIIDGKCVRLEKGDFSRCTVYSGDPVAVAREFTEAGLRRLHIVDLEGAKQGRAVNLKVLEAVAANTDLVIDFGGGIATDDDLQAVFDAGASMASVGTVAVKSPERFSRWLDHYGAGRLLLGADVRGRWLAINGWQTVTEMEITVFLTKYADEGVKNVFVTDIAKDGLLKGPSLELYRHILGKLPNLKLIASGGVSSLEDVRKLAEVGCTSVIIGKAIYEGRIAISDLASIAMTGA